MSERERASLGAAVGEIHPGVFDMDIVERVLTPAQQAAWVDALLSRSGGTRPKRIQRRASSWAYN